MAAALVGDLVEFVFGFGEPALAVFVGVADELSAPVFQGSMDAVKVCFGFRQNYILEFALKFF